MRIPQKRYFGGVLLDSFLETDRYLRDGRLATAGEFYTLMIQSRLRRPCARGKRNVIAQTIAIKLRGRGPNADYMAAIAVGSPDAGTPAAPQSSALCPALHLALRQYAWIWRQHADLAQRVLEQAAPLDTFHGLILALQEATDGGPQDDQGSLARVLSIPAPMLWTSPSTNRLHFRWIIKQELRGVYWAAPQRQAR